MPLAFAALQKSKRLIGRNSVQPGVQLALLPKTIKVSIHLYKRILQHIIRIFVALHHPSHVLVQAVTVGTDQQPKPLLSPVGVA